MSSSDGSKLAPVTYLFPRGGDGARNTEPLEETEPSEETRPSEETEPSDEKVSSDKWASERDIAPVERNEPAERESSVRFVDLDEAEEPSAGRGRGSAYNAQESADARAEKRAERVAQRQSRSDGEFEPINNVSLHALGRRGISAAEMSEFLLRRGFDAEAVDAECERLLGVGLLDDALLAEALVRTFRERKGLGRGAVAAELKRRKIDPLVIENTLSEIDSDDDSGRALELAIKRAPQLRNLDYATAQRRLSAFLMRKGYSSSAVSTAVATALAGNQSRSGGPVFR